MVEAVSGIASAAAAAPPPGPRSAGDWAREALSWASPGGLVLHAVQPIAAEALRRSGVGQGTEWGRSLQRVLDDPRSASGFQQGFGEGVWNGAKGLVEGAWSLAKGVGQIAYDKSLLGEGLDLLRHQGVAVPDWAPSADRVDAKMQAVGEGIGRYLSEVGQNPAKLGDDVKGWIGANWDALKADHAKAAAPGGAAEARWWGQITGRATFEVAAVAVPATKFATVAKAGEALNVALKAGKLGETFAEAARAGKLFELWGAAAKAGKAPELVAEARQAGRLGELVAEARKARGGLEALAGGAKLSYREIGELEKAGVLSKAEGYTARAASAVARLGSEIDESARLSGLSRSEIIDIMATAKEARPLPSAYLSDKAIAQHLAKFDQGAVRVTTQKAINDFGSLGSKEGAFVIPYREYAEMVSKAKGNPAVIEKALGLDAGALSKGDVVIAKVEPRHMDSLRMATGREAGANDWWLPGGYTSGQMSEAVMNFDPKTPAVRLIWQGK